MRPDDLRDVINDSVRAEVPNLGYMRNLQGYVRFKSYDADLSDINS